MLHQEYIVYGHGVSQYMLYYDTVIRVQCDKPVTRCTTTINHTLYHYTGSPKKSEPLLYMYVYIYIYIYAYIHTSVLSLAVLVL